MLILGICGGSGSGKSYVCEKIASYQIPTLNTDKLYHDIIASDSECSRALLKAFGPEIGNEQGGIDRAKLKQIIFGSHSSENRMILNKIAHHYIHIETVKWIELQKQKGYRAITIDAPLLFESKFNEMCDFVIAVVAPKPIRVQRICFRDHMSQMDAEQRIAVQISNEDLIARSHFHINNDGNTDINIQIETILSKLNLL